jgi:hypothetical protein
MADILEPGYRKYWRQALQSLKSESHAITNEYPEAASVVQQVHKVTGDIEVFAKCTSARAEENSQWTTIVYNAEKNRAKFANF